VSYERVSPPQSARKSRGAITITGQGVKIRCRRYQLEITDGFPLEGPQQTRTVTRATARIERIVLTAGSGYITLDALDTAAEWSAPIIALRQSGTIRFTLLPGPGGLWRTNLRRSQALAPWHTVGLEIVRRLLREKHRQQQALLTSPLFQRVPRLAPSATPSIEARVARGVLDCLLDEDPKASPSIQSLRHAESAAAEAYFAAWRGIAPQFGPPSYARTAPEHWRMFTSRHSPISGGGKDATDPVNALLNLGYALLEAETLIACHAQGLDPALGMLHADRDARLSFIYDLMEPARPAADALVLDLLASHTFRRGELWALRNGVCRLDQELAARLCGKWMPRLRVEISPIVEQVASLLRRAHITRADHPAHSPLPQTPVVPEGVCPECGSVGVRRGRRFCSAACYQVWWKANVMQRVTRQGNATLARLRAKGQDPSHGGEAGRKRAAATSRVKRHEWMALSPDERRRRTAPATRARWAPATIAPKTTREEVKRR